MKLSFLSILSLIFLLLLTNQQCIQIQNQSLQGSNQNTLNIRYSVNVQKKQKDFPSDKWECITNQQCSLQNGIVVTEKNRNGLERQVCKFCKLNQRWNGSECECLPGFSKNPEKICQSNNQNLRVASEKLSAPVIIGPKKPQCKSPAIKINSSCVCPNDTQVYSQKGCILNPCTNLGEQWDVIKYKCKCSENYEYIKGKCVFKCKINEFWSETLKTCLCNTRSAILEGKCTLCSKYAVKSEKDLCQCKKGFAGNGFECKKLKI